MIIGEVRLSFFYLLKLCFFYASKLDKTFDNQILITGFSLGCLHMGGFVLPHMGGGGQVQGDKALMGGDS